MSEMEERELKLSINFEGTTTNGVAKLRIGKGLTLVGGRSDLSLDKGRSKVKNEVIREVTMSQIRIERPGAEPSSVRRSYVVLANTLGLPSHLLGYGGGRFPGVPCLDGVQTSLNFSYDVDELTHKRIKQSQGWTADNLKEAYTQISAGKYLIRVQPKGEVPSPVLRSLLLANGMSREQSLEHVDDGITVTKTDFETHLQSAHGWLAQIPSNSLNLADIEMTINVDSAHPEDELIKATGIAIIKYSTLNPNQPPEEPEEMPSKKLGKKHGKKHYKNSDKDEESSSAGSEEEEEEEFRPAKSSKKAASSSATGSSIIKRPKGGH